MVVADDEILSLQLMEKIIDWESNNIEIAGLALNGKDALDMIENEYPEILITDIRMPQMDGLDLIKHLRSENSNIKIIIISAYSEFEYAQRALSYGVSGYLVKPIDEIKLKSLIDIITAEINNEKLQKQNNYRGKEAAQGRLLKMLLHQRKDKSRLLEALNKLDTNISLKNFQLLNITIDNLTYDEFIRFEEMHLNETLDIIDFIRNNLGKMAADLLIFENNPGEWLIILDIAKESFSALELAKNISDTLNNVLGINCFIGISEIFSGLSELNNAYMNTLDIIKYRFYFGNLNILDRTDININFNTKEIKKIEKEKLLMENIITGNKDAVIEFVESALTEIDSSPEIDPEKIYAFCFEIIILIKQRVLQEAKEISILQELNKISPESLKHYKTLHELKKYLLGAISAAMGVSSANEKENNRLIQKAKDYINQCYDTNITLETICNSIAVSKNYFCYLFKRVMGVGIWDYLTHIRVEKAKELLIQSNLKSYEISYKVGYDNPSYFTKTFKKQTGLTPQEFRDRN